VRLNASSLLRLGLALGVAGCGRGSGEAPPFGYRESFGGIEVVALTPPEQFVGRAPLMLPERAEQELVDAGIRDENPRFFAPTEAPPAGTRAMAEFEPVDAVHLAFDAATEGFVGELLRAIVPVAPVIVTLTANQSRGRVDELLRSSGLGGRDVRILGLQHDNLWTRDFGPLSVELPDGRPAFLDFRYPQTRVLDDGMPSALAEALGAPVYRVPLRLEGGVVMTNGQGLCVTTTTLAVQNSEIPLDALVRQLSLALGCSRLVFLESPGDEATGHVDMLAKFTSPDTVLVGAFDPTLSPEEAARMERNARLLEDIPVGFRRRLRVVRVPMPAPEGIVHRSYTNSLLVNGTAVVPTYGRGATEEAEVIEAYRRALPPGWRVVTVDASRVIELGGAVHCAALELRFADRGRPS
jgi:agmatine deiminase